MLIFILFLCILISHLNVTLQVIFFTNHGAVCCGESIEEAFYNAYNIVTACETQVN